MSPEESREEFKYWAFISYSHADEKWAQWLHKGLETYKIPRRLVGKTTREGVIPPRIYPVFRDRDELPGSANLGENIKAALRQSRYLIVICSPRAAASKWVDQEIRMYKAMGREDRVLCLVIDGEPNTHEKPELGLPEALPQSVRYWVDLDGQITEIPTEPIAADARRGKDGRQNALLKILAGVLSVDFDDLKQREQERKEQRLKTVLMSILLVVGVFLYLCTELYYQKNQADNARRLAVDEKDRAERARKVAEEATQQALKARESEVVARQQEIEARKQAESATELERLAKIQAEKARGEEAASKHLAIEAEKKAIAARNEAIENEKRIRRTLAASDLTASTTLIEKGQEAQALAYLSRAMRYDPENSAVVSRIISLLSQRNWPLPLCTPLKHKAEVRSFEYHPDGHRALTVAGNAATVWNLDDGRLLFEARHGDKVNAARFSQDGRWMVTASKDGTAQVWDAGTGKKQGSVLKHADMVLDAALSPNGQLVATACQNKTAQLWDATTGEAKGASFPHDGPVRGVLFNADGSVLVTLAQNSARLWSVANAQALGVPLNHEGGIYAATFSPNGKLLATTAAKQIRLWDATTGLPVSESFAHNEWVNSIEFSPDGKAVLTASKDGTVRTWEVPGGRPLSLVLKHETEVFSASYSPNGRWIATGSADGMAHIWEAATGQEITEPIRHADVVRVVRFHAAGYQVATASDDTTVRISSITPARPLSEPLRHEQGINVACISPDGRLAATGSSDRSARLWEVASGQPVSDPLRHEQSVSAIKFSPNNQWLITGSEDWKIRIWEVATGKLVGSPLRHDGWVNNFAFSPDGKYLVSASEDRTVRLWNLATGNPVLDPLRHDGPVKSAAFSSDGKWVVATAFDKTVRLWDVSTGKAVKTYKDHEGEVRAVALSPDDQWVASGSEDKSVHLWSTATGANVIEPITLDGPVQHVAFVPQPMWKNQKWLLTASDKVIRIWDATSGKPVTEPLKHAEPIKQVMFGGNGSLFLTVFGKNARVWETSTAKPVSDLLTHEAAVRSASFSPNGNFIITASADQTARIWFITLGEASPAWLGELADAVGGYRLDDYGATQPIQDSWGRFTEIQAQMAKAAAGDLPAQWGRWFLANRASRAMSAFSRVNIPEYAQRRIEEGTPSAINEAVDLQPDNGLALAKLARLTQDADQAELYIRLASKFDPTNPEVLWQYAQMLQQRGRMTEAFAAMETALARDPRNVSTMTAEGAEFTQANKDNTVSRGWLPKGWSDHNAAAAISATYSKLADPPREGLPGFGVSIQNTTGGAAQIRGPRFLCRAKAKCVIEGWARSKDRLEVKVAFRQIVDPTQRFIEVPVRLTAEWKPFKVSYAATTDIAIEVSLSATSSGSFELAGVSIRQE